MSSSSSRLPSVSPHRPALFSLSRLALGARDAWTLPLQQPSPTRRSPFARRGLRELQPLAPPHDPRCPSHVCAFLPLAPRPQGARWGVPFLFRDHHRLPCLTATTHRGQTRSLPPHPADDLAAPSSGWRDNGGKFVSATITDSTFDSNDASEVRRALFLHIPRPMTSSPPGARAGSRHLQRRRRVGPRAHQPRRAVVDRRRGRPVLAVRRRLLCRRLRHVGRVRRRRLLDRYIISELRPRLPRPGLGHLHGVRDGHVQLVSEPARVRRVPDGSPQSVGRRAPRRPRHGGRLRAVPERAIQRRAGRRDVRGVRG